MIQNLNYSDGKITKFSQVDVIHSGKSKNKIWCIDKGNWTILDYGGHLTEDFHLRRLSIK